MSCDAALRPELYGTLVLSGGNTLFTGIGARIARDLHALGRRPGPGPEVIAPPERNHSTWIGGSILASLSSFKPEWVTLREYDEGGPSILETRGTSKSLRS